MNKEFYLKQFAELTDKISGYSNGESVLNNLHSLMDISNDILSTNKTKYPAMIEAMKKVLNETFDCLVKSLD